ncbi:hypothetical protein LTR53_007310 [Teratosphaeriaceae sp. CCFEE 6253]|nr:hypothetical protein LTR53_007310 [Teratosphaeriaceae sp. CCFEE 6253]
MPHFPPRTQSTAEPVNQATTSSTADAGEIEPTDGEGGQSAASHRDGIGHSAGNGQHVGATTNGHVPSSAGAAVNGPSPILTAEAMADLDDFFAAPDAYVRDRLVPVLETIQEDHAINGANEASEAIGVGEMNEVNGVDGVNGISGVHQGDSTQDGETDGEGGS